MDYYKIATIVLSVIVFYLMLSNWYARHQLNEIFETFRYHINRNTTDLNHLVERVDTLEAELPAKLRELGDSTTEQVDILEKELKKSREGIWHKFDQVAEKIDRTEQNLLDRINYKEEPEPSFGPDPD